MVDGDHVVLGRIRNNESAAEERETPSANQDAREDARYIGRRTGAEPRARGGDVEREPNHHRSADNRPHRGLFADPPIE